MAAAFRLSRRPQHEWPEQRLERPGETASQEPPALNVIGMRDGSEATFGNSYNVLPIWKDRPESHASDARWMEGGSVSGQRPGAGNPFLTAAEHKQT